MDYGQHLVTTLVYFVKTEGGKGASVWVGALVIGASVRGLLSGGCRQGVMSGGLCPTPGKVL